MREFLKNLEPMPPQLDYNAIDKQKMAQTEERLKWRLKLKTAHELQFSDREKKLMLKFAAAGHPLNLSQYRRPSLEPAIEFASEADVITAWAHQMDGVKLFVEK
jgi:hypothetical protein